MQQHSGQAMSFYNKLPILSIIFGIQGILCCCNPPTQLILGGVAITLAWLSKNGKPLNGTAAAGLITGVISIILSLVVFAHYIWTMNIAQDPANNAMIRDIYQQTKDILDAIMIPQGNE